VCVCVCVRERARAVWVRGCEYTYLVLQWLSHNETLWQEPTVINPRYPCRGDECSEVIETTICALHVTKYVV
jgi:hypothetical protein